MSEPDDIQPFEQRKSQNLHFGDYAKSTLFWASLPLIGGALTLLGGMISKKYFNNKLWPLDGSPIITQTLYEKGFSHITNKTFGQKLELGEVERLWFINRFFPSDQRLAVTHHIWNFLKGVELAAIPTVYHFWKRDERQRLNLEPAFDRLKQLETMNPTDAELKADNASLRTQIDTLGPAAAEPSHHTPGTRTGHAQHQGKVAHTTHERSAAN